MVRQAVALEAVSAHVHLTRAVSSHDTSRWGGHGGPGSRACKCPHSQAFLAAGDVLAYSKRAFRCQGWRRGNSSSSDFRADCQVRLNDSRVRSQTARPLGLLLHNDSVAPLIAVAELAYIDCGRSRNLSVMSIAKLSRVPASAALS